MRRGTRLTALTGLGILTLAVAPQAWAADPTDLVTNGSFEAPDIPTNTFAVFGSIPGWTRTVAECGIEIQDHVSGGEPAPGAGDQYVELDSNCSTGISQTVATEPGLRYEIAYLYSPRTADFSDSGSFENNRLEVVWDGTIVDVQQRANALTSTDWTAHIVSVVATASSSELVLRDGATDPAALDDSLGVYIDEVSVVPVFDLCPLYDPTKAHKAGSTVPLRVQLCDSEGDNLSSSAHSLHATDLRKIDSSSGAVVEDSGEANPDDDFRFDADLAGYIFNLSTKGLSSGTWALDFTVDGGAHIYTATFDVR